jgi:acetyltransferase
MTVRNLDAIFKPDSIALISASQHPQSIGAVVARNLFRCGFDGPIMPVNPHERAVEGVWTYKTVDDLPVVPDLAVICTPPETVPGLVASLGARGTKGAIVITASFGEGGDAGKALQQQLLDAAKPHLLRVVGPNCLGVMVPGRGLNASFVHVPPHRGDIALVAQSGAVLTSVVDWASARGIGFSHVVSLGGKADVDFGDLLDYLALDPAVRAVLLYIETVTHARKFMSAARVAARQKPVIVIKAGRSDEAAKAATSHTGALAGSDAVYDAAFRRAGMLRVNELEELFAAVETLSTGVKIQGDRLAILTNGGGMGVLATDSLIQEGGRLSSLAPETMEALNRVLPPTWSQGNPVDILGDAPGQRYADALSALLKAPRADAILVMNSPTAVADSLDAARAVVEILAQTDKAGHPMPVLTNWLGIGAPAEARRLFASHRLPTYETPGQAIRAFMHLVRYRRNQEQLMETPPSIPQQFSYDQNGARRIIASVLAEKRNWLNEFEAKAVLKSYAVPVVETRQVADPEAAARAAQEIGKPVALKIVSPEITHKSDIGGVVLHLNTPEEVLAQAKAMLVRVRETRPDARIEGFTVQEMAEMPDALELIVGMVDDVQFGPVVLFGQGGIAVEVVGDQALALPPLNMSLAHELMTRTRIHKLLKGFRAWPPADLDAIALTLIKVSQLVIDFPEIAELDINPLFADSTGVLVLDARIRVMPSTQEGAKRLAIRPYPQQLERVVRLSDGREFLLRPIRPEDEPLVQAMFARMTPEDIRLRFFAPKKTLSHQMAARLTQIDYDREMGLVAVSLPRDDAPQEMNGIVHIVADPDNVTAEYAVMVRSDMKGKGLGYFLMSQILDYARERGLKEIHGEVLRENTSMLQMCNDLGFERRKNPDEPGVVQVRATLG